MEAALERPKGLTGTILSWDRALQPAGVTRAPLWKFCLWMLFWGAVALWGVYAAALCWIYGLNQTNMNDYYGFAIWIWADLAVIALGGGAFFTGFLKYVLGHDKPLKYIVNYAVLIGFICYSSALLILAIDIGQPLRGWFIFWNANVHSMLTEVAFCLTCYFIVLSIEYAPNILENRVLSKVPFLKRLAHNFHSIMALFAATGVFLSFFHQGSLGGVAGVLFGRPFAYREGVFIWPWTFFLFTWSAAAYGPCFTMLLSKIIELVTGKTLIPAKTYDFLAKVAGWMMGTYMVAKIADTLYWAYGTLPASGFTLSDFYVKGPFYGYWILALEIVAGGIIPAAILLSPKARAKGWLLVPALVLAVVGVCVNRWAMVVEMNAIPVLNFDTWALYSPSWQEVATTILPVAYGVLLISLSHRYLPLFPLETGEGADH